MNAEIERKDPARPNSLLCIEGEMTIYQATELKQSLLAFLEQGDELEIDLSAVTEIDTAGVQLLIAAGKTAEARQKGLRLTRPSAVVADVFALFCLDAGISSETR